MKPRPDMSTTPLDQAPAKRSFFRLALVAGGVLAPLAVYAFAAGTVSGFGPSRGDAMAVADTASAIDCESPRAAWRSACQGAKAGPDRQVDETVAADDEPATTGSVERRTRRRTSATELAAAARPWVDPSSPEPAPPAPETRAEPGLPGAPQDVARPAEPAKSSPAQASAPAQGAAKPGDTEKASVQSSEPASRAVERIAAPPAAETRPSASAARAEAKTEKVEAAASPSPDGRDTAKPSANLRRVVSRREAARRREAADPVPAPEVREEASAQAPAAREARRPPRLAKSRPKPNDAKPSEAPDAEVAVRQETPPERRVTAERPLRTAPVRTVRGKPAVPPGMTVTSIRTYEFPDGRRVTVQVQPKPEDVRKLLAHHEAQTARLRALPEADTRFSWFR